MPPAHKARPAGPGPDYERRAAHQVDSPPPAVLTVPGADPRTGGSCRTRRRRSSPASPCSRPAPPASRDTVRHRRPASGGCRFARRVQVLHRIASISGATESRAGDARSGTFVTGTPRNPQSSAHQGSAERGDSQTLIIQDKQPHPVTCSRIWHLSARFLQIPLEQRRTIRRSLINFLIFGRKIVNNAPIEDDHELTSKDNGQHEARTGRELRRGLACAAAEQRGGSTGSGTHVLGVRLENPASSSAGDG